MLLSLDHFRSLARVLFALSILPCLSGCTANTDETPPAENPQTDLDSSDAADGASRPYPPNNPGAGPERDMEALELSCVGILVCVEDCAETDRACLDACVEKGTDLAELQVRSLTGCIQKAQCPEGDADCLTRSCGSRMEICEGIQRDTGCKRLGQCISGCNNYADCHEKCASSETPQTITAFEALLQCTVSRQCHSPLCRQLWCGEEIVACQET